MAELAKTLHLATDGYHVQPGDQGSNALAQASVHHVRPTPVVPPTFGRVFDHDCPYIQVTNEIDNSQL